MAVATEGLEKLEDMIVRQAEATGTTMGASCSGSTPAASSSPRISSRPTSLMSGCRVK
jgi:hypothetical protein